jgi:NAD(P)-dependent dehydrogenase (short-subunit alcohol dehydrogenase family)
VTGASRGLGRAIAQRLASEGAVVAAVARTLRPGGGTYAGSLEETVALIEAAGGRAVAVPFDLGDPARDRPELVRSVEERVGGAVDILVNNAAAARHYDVRFTTMTRDLFRDTVEVNVWAAWDLALAVLPAMRAQGSGWILNVSSRAAEPKVGPPFHLPSRVGAQCLYGASKAMLDRLTTGAAAELWDDAVAVNALAPEAAVATENAVSASGVTPEISEPAETFAEAALALCSGDPRTLTGRVAYSLSLLVELDRPVRTLDGAALVEGWQPGEIDRARLFAGYLAGTRP